MKKIVFLFSLLFVLASCGKNKIDSSNSIAFRKSVNQMMSKLDTRQQVKFNEALYILKTFGSDEESYVKQMSNLMQMLSGKNTNEVLALADQVAQKHGIDWTSTGAPSLGQMNVFDETSAKEMDPNEIIADEIIQIGLKPTAYDSIKGPKAVRIIPRLMKNGSQLYFKGATLPTTLEIFSGGKRLLKRKNLIQDSNFKGFYLSYDQLPQNKILNGQIDLLVTIKAANKTYSTQRDGVRVNLKVFNENSALKSISYDDFATSTEHAEEDSLKPNNTSEQSKSVNSTSTEPSTNQPSAKTQTTTEEVQKPTKAIQPAKAVVKNFLSNLSSQNLKAAYNNSANPSWGSYDKFADTNSGFGSVKSLNVKRINTSSENNTNATVNAVYDVEDKNGNKSSLNVEFGLKHVNGNWKITTYKIK